MQELPKVNILICNHNYGQYLKDAVNSALDQTYPCYITIVDDGSTDDSFNVIEQIVTNGIVTSRKKDSDGIELFEVDFNYKTNPTTCLVIRLPQSFGPSEARNVGIAYTIDNTDVYAILDADDIMKPTKVEKLINVLYQSPNIGVAYADYDCLNVHTGNLIREYKEPYDMMRLKQECIVHSGSLIRKEALQSVLDKDGYYDRNLRVCEDYDLWLRIANNFMLAHCPESLTIVRVHNRNSTNSVNTDVWNQCITRVRQKMQQ